MLVRLIIQNYALIKKLDISFHNGFSTITGETGAGKSIMLDALGLVLGNRADTRVIGDHKRKCIVEAQFSIEGYGLEELFVSHETDYEPETILRREILPEGKSRAFVNDSPVNLNVLREIGSRLINIHSQHEVLVLNNRDFQLAMLDTFAGNEKLLGRYQEKYSELREREKRLEELISKRAEYLSQYDYDSFLHEELVNAKPEQDNLEELEERLRILSHAAEIRNLLFQGAELITGEPIRFSASLKNIAGKLEKLSAGQTMEELSHRLNSLVIEISDLSLELERLGSTLHEDPEEQDRLNERIGFLNHLLNKHRVGSIDGLVLLKEELGRRLSQQQDLSEVIEETRIGVSRLEEEVHEMAGEISVTRHQAAEPMLRHLETLLHQLGMPDARVELRIDKHDTPGSDGADKVTLLFTANKGGSPDLISRVASGGELSRLMLAVKSVLSSRRLIPTIIFDEIDSGVSGDIAGKTGNLMRKMGDSMQVIAITHLPQIAAKGESQYLAVKSVEEGETVSDVYLLSPDNRIKTIAGMLSDGSVTPESEANARQLLGMIKINT
jgi:DNA repair protein RecN (Recombination protein N)